MNAFVSLDSVSLLFFACARWYFWFYTLLQQHTIHVVVSGFYFPPQFLQKH